MKVDLHELKEEVSKLRALNISNEDLGVHNDFRDAENIKNEITDRHLAIIDNLEKYSDNFPSKIIEEYIQTIRSHLSNFKSQLNSINQIVKKGVHTPEYPGNRTNYIAAFQQNENGFNKQLFEIEQAIHLNELSEIINKDDKLKEKLENADRDLLKIDKMIKDSKQMLGDISDLSLVKTLKESAGSFDKLRENHFAYEKRWFVAFIISASLIVLSVLFIYFGNFTGETNSEIVTNIFKKLLLLGLPALIMRISLKKYNLERNLKIIYDHRSTVLEQYKNFENSIGDDQDAKNMFRLEIAKYIFTDPNTGYIADVQSNDLSVNPVVNIAEKLASRN